MPLLDIQDISIRFGGLTAVSDFSMTMEENDMYAASSARTAPAKPRFSIC